MGNTRPKHARNVQRDTGYTTVCSSTARSDLAHMERRLAYLGCTRVRVIKGSERRNGKLLRTFVLQCDSQEYNEQFPVPTNNRERQEEQ